MSNGNGVTATLSEAVETVKDKAGDLGHAIADTASGAADSAGKAVKKATRAAKKTAGKATKAVKKDVAKAKKAATRVKKPNTSASKPGASTTRHMAHQKCSVPTQYHGNSVHDKKVMNAGNSSPEAWRIRYMPMA